MPFAVAALAILAATAWRSAPAAAARRARRHRRAWRPSPCGPASRMPPEPRLLAPALDGVLRLPDNVASFLIFAALSTLAVGAAADAAAVARPRACRSPTAGLYALAAVVPPLLALVLAYLRVTQFDRSISFALIAVALAGVFYLVADRFDRRRPAEQTRRHRISAIGALRLRRGRRHVARLRHGARPRLSDRRLRRHRLHHRRSSPSSTASRCCATSWSPSASSCSAASPGTRASWAPTSAPGRSSTGCCSATARPPLAFLGAGRILKREGEDLAVRICDALGVLFAALLVFFQIRHALNGGDPLAASLRPRRAGPVRADEPRLRRRADPHRSRRAPTRCSAPPR